MDDFVRESSRKVVRVCSAQADQLRGLVVAQQATVSIEGPGLLAVDGMTAPLEEAFMELTHEEVE